MFPNYVTKKSLDAFITNAILEDVGDGDHSTLAIMPKELQNRARLWVKEDCVLAGVELAVYIFSYFDKDLKVKVLMKDGDIAKIGNIAFEVEGSARSILTSERLVLNCMQRMSGIATLTQEYQTIIKKTNTKLLDTRKTTPNFRLCEKWAVLIGGGINHRYGLYDMVMLKDNHIDYAGGITKAVAEVKKYLKTNNKTLRIEVETRNIAEVKEALLAKVDRIMLDNMPIDMMKEAVAIIDNQCESEASGGITKINLLEIAQTGVDYISSGALTHSATNKDLSLKAF